MATHRIYWKRLSKKWKYFAPPFRPHQLDIDFISGVVNSETPTFYSNRIMILGVTPEFSQMEIPEGCELIAVDSCKEMIENVWPEMPCPNRKAVLANWLDLPFENHSCDIVLGDGVFGTMRYPTESKNFLRSVRNVLHPNGLFIFRTFLRDDTTETPKDVFDAVLDGEIKTLNTFKFRLIRSVQPDLKTGAKYHHVWEALVNEGPDFGLLTKKTGWSIQEVETMKLYNGAEFVLTYPTLFELRNILKQENYEEIECFCPDYELGEFCQTLVFTPAN
jgi:SAM-dependent methyltransferase